MLHFPNLDQEFILHVNACDLDAGAMSIQKRGDAVAVIVYFNKRFGVSQNYFGTSAKECYAVVPPSQHWILILSEDGILLE